MVTLEYEEFKVRINGLVAKAQKVPDEGWVMQDGTLWPGNNTRDHPGMIQVFLGHSGGLDSDGNELPRPVYVSRDKCLGFRHHKKAGSMNALHGVERSHVFLDGSQSGKVSLLCSVSPNHYANRNTVFFDINLRGLDGIQGPEYVGTGCVFNKMAPYGYEPPLKPKHKKPGLLSSCFGGSRKKSSKTSRKNSIKKKSGKHVNSTLPINNLEDIEEGLEGAGFNDENSLLMSQMRLEKGLVN
ncbi:hypothetical protein PTKIN_Ptkin06aG0092500 [Pterospermum kingtungense]